MTTPRSGTSPLASPPAGAELAASRAQLPGDAFAPFSQDVWLDSLYEHQLVYGCLRWPAPAVADPPAPPGAAYPTVPVLVLNGDLDVITPMSDAARAAALFPNATLVPVGNAVHVTALADFDDCAARIVRDFLRSHVVGDTSCASELAELHVVPAFPRTTAAAPAATRAAGDASNAGDRRAGWTAAHTVARRALALVADVRASAATGCAAGRSGPAASTTAPTR